MGHLREMVAHGYRPSKDDFKVLHLRCCENERWDLLQKVASLCQSVESNPPNPFAPWRQRSRAVADLLKKVYGKDAPEAATNIESEN